MFLETEFYIRHNQIHHRLKNTNTQVEDEIWRYQHFNSYAPFIQKQATIQAALQKVQFHASDARQLICSGVRKLREFAKAGYPISVIRFHTRKMAAHATHDAYAWAIVRKQLEREMVD